MAERCRASCRFLRCTGRGDLEAYAHVCSVLGIPRALPTCDAPDCFEPGALMARGRRCPAHRPAQPVPGPPIRATPTWTRRTPADYGTATTDPLGRNAPEWIVSDRTGLPTRVKR